MTASGVRGVDLFQIAGRSISGWVPSLKTGNPYHVRQPFCSQLEERLLMYLEYHPQVTWYARGDVDADFAASYRLPNVVGRLANGKLFIAEAGADNPVNDI